MKTNKTEKEVKQLTDIDHDKLDVIFARYPDLNEYDFDNAVNQAFENAYEGATYYELVGLACSGIREEKNK